MTWQLIMNFQMILSMTLMKRSKKRLSKVKTQGIKKFTKRRKIGSQSSADKV
jgi:hypothetical protein